MSITPTSQPALSDTTHPVPVAAPTEIDSSCRLPLLVLFLSAALWALFGSALLLVVSIKFHSPQFLADPAWLTYGRVWPAGVDSMLYGFYVQAGLGVGLWLLARLGRTLLAQPLLIILGALCWNLGLTAGIVGILGGDSTGFETLEMPAYSVLMLFLGYLLIGLCGLLTFQARRQRLLFASQWFLVAALFWFPWIYSTAELLLVVFPVRGVAQSVIAWWYGQNLLVVWLGLVGLAAVFYFVPKQAQRDLHSHYLALFAFWMLLLVGGWGGIPGSAPVPAWMPAVSAVASVLMVLLVLTVALNVRRTLAGVSLALRSGGPLCFITLGVVSFGLAGLMKASTALLQTNLALNLSWFARATTELQFYGFFAMLMFGVVYYILPQITGVSFLSAKLVRVHFWFAAVGVLAGVLPLAIGGVIEAVQFQNANIAFINISKATLPFLRISTVGDLAITLGHILFLVNLGGLASRLCRARAAAAYAAATADLKAAEVRA